MLSIKVNIIGNDLNSGKRFPPIEHIIVATYFMILVDLIILFSKSCTEVAKYACNI